MSLLQVKHQIIVVLNKLNKYIDFNARGVWFFTILLLSFFVHKIQAQANTCLLRVNNRIVTLDEFEQVYRNQAGEINNTPEEYAHELIDFLLLATKAETLKLDTLPSFRSAIKVYKDSVDFSALLHPHSLETTLVETEPMVNVSLLLLRLPQHISSRRLQRTEHTIDSIYTLLQQGFSFDEAVGKFSAYKQPLLLKRAQLSKELLDAIDTLENGKFSQPFHEPQGICIVRLNQKNHRDVAPHPFKIDSIIDQKVQLLKQTYHFRCNERAKNELLRSQTTQKVLFNLGNREYHSSDFQTFAHAHPMPIQKQWDDFVKWAVLQCYYKELHQSLDYTLNLRMRCDSLLVKLYQDSIMPMHPSEETLTTYFLAHKKQYTWKEKRFKGIVLQSADKKMLKSVRKWLKKLPYDEWQDALRMVINKDSLKVLSTQQLFCVGDNPYVDEKIFKQGKAKSNPQFPYVEVYGKRLKSPEDVNMVIDSVLDDYLSDEKERLLNELRASSNVEINQEVLKTVNSMNTIN